MNPAEPRSQNSRSSAGGRRLHFVTYAGPQSQDDAETRRRIRSHVQAEYRRRNPRPQRQTTIELSLSPLLGHSVPVGLQATDPLQIAQSQYDQGVAVLSSPLTPLDASRSDPFRSFELDQSRRTRQLWDHVYDGSCAKFRSLIAIGFIDLVRETIAISQMLSAAAWHLVHHLKCEEDSAEDAKYSIMTTQSLQQKLDDPSTYMTDEVITAVLACAAYSNLSHDLHSFDVHIDGLIQILRRRGGEESLDGSPVLRMALFWIEVNGCFLQDSPPRFRLPYHLLGPRSRISLPMYTAVEVAQGTHPEAQESVVITNTSRTLNQVDQLIADEDLVKNCWYDVSFSVFNLSPILYELLSLPHGSVHSPLRIRQRECFRLAAIIYVTGLRAKFDPAPGAGTLYGSKLRLLLETSDMMFSWNGSADVLIWILAVAASSPCILEDLQSYFVTRLADCLSNNHVLTSQAFSDAVHRVSWSHAAFRMELETLERRLYVFQG